MNAPFLIVIEKAAKNYSAYSQDMEGCSATGKVTKEVKKNMQKAIELHLRGLQEDDLPIPKYHALADYISWVRLKVHIV